ncbi:MAG: GDSL family lipase [Oscillospiraceae bacterium]|nr:GDSL family lipase [Oscillospiraceae bacterium]
MEIYPADSKHVRTIGRSLFRDGIRYLSWSCSSVEFTFTGTEVTAEIWTDWVLDEPWKEIFQGYLAVFVNDEPEPRLRFPVDTGTNQYPIYKSDRMETVKIRIMKLSEAAFNKIGIAGISADGEITPTDPLPRRIEFIGDSITCGFGIEGKSAEEGFRTATENPYISYAALTARELGADFHLISWSTIGVYSSDCKDENAEKPNDGWVMPKLYDYTDIGIEGTLGIEDHIPWDFKSFVPDVIVINLGTNDVSFTKDIPERLEGFKQAYMDFLKNIRNKNPEAVIVCTLGMMCNELFPAIEAAVRDMKDSRIHTLEFDVQKPEDGFGSEKHPNAVTHRKAAEKLTGKIIDIMGY